MAKRQAVTSDEKGVAIYLVNATPKAQDVSAADIRKDQDRVTKAVQNEGGQCRLFGTAGGLYDYVSIVEGITLAAAVRIARSIDQGGLAKATLMSGITILK